MVAKIPTLELNLGEERRGVQAKAAWDATPGRLGSAPHRQGCARPPVPEAAPLATLRGEQVRHLMESIRLLANVSDLFVAKCLDGIAANRERAKALLEGSPVMVTALAPVIGHDPAAQIAEEALSSGRSLRELCLERKLVAPEELERLLDPRSQTEPRALTSPPELRSRDTRGSRRRSARLNGSGLRVARPRTSTSSVDIARFWSREYQVR